MRFFWKTAGKGPARAPDRRARLFLEELESRVVPYATTGNAWPSPQLITLSFMPDGTVISQGVGGTVTSDLFAHLNAHTGWTTSTWQNAIIAAAQAWAQYGNINFTVVSDNGTASGGGNYQQGDPGMGDIRIGAYALPSNALGQAFQPPPVNNYSIAGDVDLSDQVTYNLGSTYDLQGVAMHEIGHALGLDESPNASNAVMWPYYNGAHKSLTTDDINGIQSIYGARAADAYNQGTSNNSFATASNLSSLINPQTQTAQVTNLDLSSTSSAEYFAVQAPQNSGNSLTVNVQSAGLSLLRPQVTVYAADQSTVLGSATGAGLYNGANLTVTINGISPLQTFYIKVTGADSTAFSTGNCDLSLAFGGASLPKVTPPNTQLLNGSVLSGGGAQALMPPGGQANQALQLLQTGQVQQFGQWLQSWWTQFSNWEQSQGQSAAQAQQAGQWLWGGQWNQFGGWLLTGGGQQLTQWLQTAQPQGPMYSLIDLNATAGGLLASNQHAVTSGAEGKGTAESPDFLLAEPEQQYLAQTAGQKSAPSAVNLPSNNDTGPTPELPMPSATRYRVQPGSTRA